MIYLLAICMRPIIWCTMPQYYDTRPYTITYQRQQELNEQERIRKLEEEKRKEEEKKKAEVDAKKKAAQKAKKKEVKKSKCKRVSASVSKEYAHSLMSSYGWNESEYSALVKLWTKESGWNNCATNGIYTGIPQTSYKKYGNNTWDYKVQIKVGLKYIKNRYGSPTKAWQHFQKKHWY